MNILKRYGVLVIKWLKNRMKSLTYKVSFIIVVSLIINILLLYLFARLFLFPEIASRLTKLSGKEFAPDHLAENNLILPVFMFELCMLIIMVMIISLIIYFTIVRPVALLNNNVKNSVLDNIEYTARKDELGQLQNSFRELSKRLTEEKQAQNRIIASISHDLKTPLTSVLGFSERLLKKDLQKETIDRYISIIYQDAKTIESIVDEFDEYLDDKLDSTLKKQKVNLSYILQMLEEEYRSELYQRNIGFDLVNRANIEIQLLIDLFKIRRVFANVINNAVKHNQNKHQFNIVIIVFSLEANVYFEILDNGNGVSEIDFPYLFEPFYTTDHSRRLSGLGLSICKNIVESHKGTIEASNRQEGGFRVSISLPLMKS